MLTVKNLDVFTKSEVCILKDISFELENNKTLCILGQSGSGKSVLAYSIMDILHKNLYVKNGVVTLDDEVLTDLKPIERRKRLGKTISLIMQNPLTALDPTIIVGKQILETLKIHNKKENNKVLIKKVYDLLEEVNLESEVYKKYPHEISGGMAQKVVIAIAIANSPKLIIADEPITALDRKNTLDILNILKEKKEQNNSSMIYISHDISSITYMADIVLVLYKGNVVEILSKEEFVNNPLHPYTIDLKNSVIKGRYKDNKIETNFLDKTSESEGCPYLSNCSKCEEKCKNEIPLVKRNNRFIRCINVEEI